MQQFMNKILIKNSVDEKSTVLPAKSDSDIFKVMRDL